MTDHFSHLITLTNYIFFKKDPFGALSSRRLLFNEVHDPWILVLLLCAAATEKQNTAHKKNTSKNKIH